MLFTTFLKNNSIFLYSKSLLSVMSVPKTGRVLLLIGYGGYDKLKCETQDVPSPGKGQVLVNVRASGVNFAELMARQGTYSTSFKLPAILGFEGAGDVVALGEGVSDVKVGDRVICITMQGLWAEYALSPADRCFPMPEGMTYEEAAAIPVNYITAYHMLFEMGGLRKGKSVLIHMVAGGVGNAAVQLCRTVDDVTIFGTCSASKHDVMRRAGVDYTIDYRTADYAEEVKKVSPKGVDIVLDPLNGADAAKGYKLLKPLGTIIHFGAANVVNGPERSIWQAAKTWWGTQNYNPLRMIPSNKCVGGYHLGYLANSPELVYSAVEELMRMYRQGQIRPQIDSVWALEDVGKAMARMHDRKNVGKVILCPQVKAGTEDIRTPGASKI